MGDRVSALLRNRWLVWVSWIILAVLALVIVWWMTVPAADWIAHHDVGSATGSLHETALDNARGRLLTLGAGLLAAGALVFTARNFTLSREGQVTDRYTKAIDQLGSGKLDVRIGGIYALERIARDSRKDHPTVMEVLSAFIREHSREQWPEPGSNGTTPERSTRPDVYAALAVVVRRDSWRDVENIDLIDADLARVQFFRANFGNAVLLGANFSNAALRQPNFRGAILAGANFSNASLARANFRDADATGAVFTHAVLTYADLTGADFTGADLTGANLTRVDLTVAVLTVAVLTGANLTGARWPSDWSVPEGWRLNPNSGRLQRASAEPAPTEAN
jgi:hypothetical protein